MISFDVYQTVVPAAFRLTRSRLAKISQAFAKIVSDQAEGQVEVSFISDDEIRRLNRMYRGKDKVTDVLSFAAGDGGVSGQLGDVLIAYDQAARQAEDGDIELELADLLVHGLLHLMGYDHEEAEDAEVMFPLQDLLVAEIL
ncbi:MAG: rRNA maturation RNase YbeY [Patescibacteria group bacterium]